jgi:hypothetical protein
LVEVIPGILAMVPKGEFDAGAQYNPGQEIEVTLLTINHTTRRITASIQHVADVPPEEIDRLVVPEIDVIAAAEGNELASAEPAEVPASEEPEHGLPVEQPAAE